MHIHTQGVGDGNGQVFFCTNLTIHRKSYDENNASTRWQRLNILDNLFLSSSHFTSKRCILEIIVDVNCNVLWKSGTKKKETENDGKVVNPVKNPDGCDLKPSRNINESQINIVINLFSLLLL